MSREELAVLLDARDKLCGFCENDACERCQVTLLIDDAYAECDELDEEQMHMETQFNMDI